MDIKLIVKSDYSERTALFRTLANFINLGLDESSETSSMKLRSGLEDFLKNCEGGKEFPGIWIDFNGDTCNSEIIFSIKPDDLNFICSIGDKTANQIKPIVEMAKVMIRQCTALGESLTTLNDEAAMHFERPRKYGTLVVDAMDSYGYIVGAVYMNDGYEVTRRVWNAYNKEGIKVYEEIVNDLLAEHLEEVDFCYDDFGDAINERQDIIAALAEKYKTYKLALVHSELFDENDKLDDATAIAVLYSEEINGQMTVLEQKCFGYNIVLDDDDLYKSNTAPSGIEVPYGCTIVDLYDETFSYEQKEAAKKAFNDVVKDAKAWHATHAKPKNLKK